MTSEVRAILDERPKHFSPWVFPNPTTGRPYSKNINKIWNKACSDAGVERTNLYNATRDSFACQLLNDGVDRGIVPRLLRHSDYRMVERHAEYNMNPLQQAVDKVRKVNFWRGNKRTTDNSLNGNSI